MQQDVLYTRKIVFKCLYFYEIFDYKSVAITDKLTIIKEFECFSTYFEKNTLF